MPDPFPATNERPSTPTPAPAAGPGLKDPTSAGAGHTTGQSDSTSGSPRWLTRDEIAVGCFRGVSPFDGVIDCGTVSTADRGDVARNAQRVAQEAVQRFGLRYSRALLSADLGAWAKSTPDAPVVMRVFAVVPYGGPDVR